MSTHLATSSWGGGAAAPAVRPAQTERRAETTTFIIRTARFERRLPKFNMETSSQFDQQYQVKGINKIYIRVTTDH